MKDILFNVDSEGSSLLHLAVESGNSEVTNLLIIILNSPLTERGLDLMIESFWISGGTTLYG